jgi:hypothetical protein
MIIKPGGRENSEEMKMNKLFACLLTGILALSWLVLPATGCDNTNVQENNHELDDVFSIYLLAEEIEGEPPYDLDKLNLHDEPWLSIEDIDYYDFSTHYIYLKTDKASLFGEELQPSASSAFVIIAGGERCYLGHFHSPVSSWLPMTPIISYYPGFELYPEDIIHIEKFELNGAEDVRKDQRIRDAISQAGKISMGLSIKLDDVKADSRNGITDVSYTFTVTNESDKPLYVPDPGKMGAGLLHYYSGGIILSTSERHQIVLSAYEPSVAPQPYDSWDVSWFTKIDSHESMERTLTFDCDEIVSNGTYACRFNYAGPSRIEKSARRLPDGRLWLGKVESNTIEISTGN